MATIRSKGQPPVGSMDWISHERGQVSQFADQENEDFAFSARNEVDWLNEHMAEIFNKNQVNVTEIFKTPGKLRGKTPRTNRKRNPLEERAPLTDVFAPSPKVTQSPSRSTPLYKQMVRSFQVAEDPSTEKQQSEANRVHATVPGKEYTDSGYHGSQDEMDVDSKAQQPAELPTLDEQVQPEMSADPDLASGNVKVHRASYGRRTTEGSFHTANEVQGSKAPADRHIVEDDDATEPDTDVAEDDRDAVEPTYPTIAGSTISPRRTSLPKESSAHASRASNNLNGSMFEAAPHLHEMRSPSDASSPVRPLVRKSSLNFASLPAREPLTTKQSIGGRVSRTSHLEQKATIPGRGSFLGRQTGGRSLGASQHMGLAMENGDNDGDDEMMDEDNDLLNDEQRPTILREESDGTKMTKLHNKTSTQRLNERINMLGQLNASRPANTNPPIATFSTQPNYPSLPRDATEEPMATEAISNDPKTTANPNIQNLHDEDDDDWIPPVQSTSVGRPGLTKSFSADVMEQISGKDSIGGMDIGLQVPERKRASRDGSPLRHAAVPGRSANPVGHRKSKSTSAITPSTASEKVLDVTHKAKVSTLSSTLNPRIPHPGSSTPLASPARPVDGPLSASKAKLSSLLKSAKGIFASSAGVSAQAKMETLSPPSMRLLNQAATSSLNQMMSTSERDVEAVSKPSISQGSPSKKDEGRKTRSSTDREEKKKAKEAEERQRADDKLEKAREKERHKATAHKVERERVASQETQIGETGGQLAPVKQVERSRDPASKMPPAADEGGITDPKDAEMVDAQPLPPAAATRSQVPPTQMQKPKDIRRPAKPIKDIPSKPKPAPVSIRVDLRKVSKKFCFMSLANKTKISQIHPQNTASSFAVQEALAPPVAQHNSLAKHPVVPALSSASGSTASAPTKKTLKPKALAAAARKKEQDEREAQRKLDQKRDVERKRAAQQEEERRQQQQQRKEAERLREKERVATAEDPKKLLQKQAIEKRRLENAERQQKVPTASLRAQPTAQQEKLSLAPPAPLRGELGNIRPGSRMNTVQDFGRSSQQPQANPARPPKRNFQADQSEEPAQRPTNARAGQALQQHDAKRRKTDEEVEEVEPRQAMPPPIRQSNVRKPPPNSTFVHGYTNAPPPQPMSHAAPSLLKSTLAGQHKTQHKGTEPNQLARFTNGKIPFAEAPNPPHAPTHKTPGAQHRLQPTTAAKSSPQYPNGDAISLPDIATDSEDEDEDNDFAPPAWANSPELRNLLHQQEAMDAEDVFGPIGPLHMEEIFKNKDRHHRLRVRTSSANWSGSDRLTEEECRRDLAARERMRRDGGWSYDL
ncbi:MAG: hypothetical protein M1812_007330 [Candelaria pacifica]|nr:MAG: hypothetical protein M1812_007330 [Candelaria pacifica]